MMRAVVEVVMLLATPPTVAKLALSLSLFSASLPKRVMAGGHVPCIGDVFSEWSFIFFLCSTFWISNKFHKPPPPLLKNTLLLLLLLRSISWLGRLEIMSVCVVGGCGSVRFKTSTAHRTVHHPVNGSKFAPQNNFINANIMRWSWASRHHRQHPRCCFLPVLYK